MSCPLKSDPDCDDPDGRTLTNWSSTWANWKTCWPTAKAAERWEIPEAKGHCFEGNIIGYWLGDFLAGHGLGLFAYLRANGDNIQNWIKHDKAIYPWDYLVTKTWLGGFLVGICLVESNSSSGAIWFFFCSDLCLKMVPSEALDHFGATRRDQSRNLGATSEKSTSP